MTHQVEIEFKTLLTREEYQRVFAFYQLDRSAFHTQTNLYFDTLDHQLKQKKFGLRIRTTEDKAELTLKSPLKEGLLETTDILSLDEAARRAEFSVTEGLLALDESWYGQSHDYELELEVSEASSGKRAFLSLLDRLHISYRPAKNKIIRALEEKLSKKEYE